MCLIPSTLMQYAPIWWFENWGRNLITGQQKGDATPHHKKNVHEILNFILKKSYSYLTKISLYWVHTTGRLLISETVDYEE